jgi:hypothetical protein
MMGDRNFAAAAVSEWLDPVGVILFSTVTLIVLGAIALFYIAHQEDLARQTFKEQCIDAGGVPTYTFDYVKGSRDGYLCINPSAIIKLKDEK